MFWEQWLSHSGICVCYCIDLVSSHPYVACNKTDPNKCAITIFKKGRPKLTNRSGSMPKIINVLTFRTTIELVQLVSCTDRIPTRRSMKQRHLCNRKICSFFLSILLYKNCFLIYKPLSLGSARHPHPSVRDKHTYNTYPAHYRLRLSAQLSFYLSPGAVIWVIGTSPGHFCRGRTIKPFHFIPSSHPPCQNWLVICCDTCDAWHGTDDMNVYTPCCTSIQTQTKGIFKIYSWCVLSYFSEGSHNITSTWW